MLFSNTTARKTEVEHVCQNRRSFGIILGIVSQPLHNNHEDHVTKGAEHEDDLRNKFEEEIEEGDVIDGVKTL